jgi:hypothetical protein
MMRSLVLSNFEVSAPAGDFDLDDDVDGADFLKWQRGESPDPLSESDLAAWEANFGTAAPLTSTSTTVPEPATGIMLLIGMATWLTGGRTLVSTQLCVRHVNTPLLDTRHLTIPILTITVSLYRSCTATNHLYLPMFPRP